MEIRQVLVEERRGYADKVRWREVGGDTFGG